MGISAKLALRKRKPYTCRFEVVGKICAKILSESEGDYCKPCQAAITKFEAEPSFELGDIKPWNKEPIWP